MGLKSDIKEAFLTSMGNPEDEGNTEQIARDISQAIITFLTKQTFTITEMKAILEVEELKTSGPLQADVLNSVSVNTTVAPMTIPALIVAAPPVATAPGATTPGTGTGTVVSGKKGVLIPKIEYKKRGGQGGAMTSVGHAYIGRNPVNSGETNEGNTKVKLLEENIVGK